MSVIVTPGPSAPIFFGIGQPPVIDIDTTSKVDVIDIEVGVSGPPGPAGPEGGTPVVPVAYSDWPPVSPEPGTLYLRLAP